MISFDLILI